jgi:hypothetical protein
VSEPVKNIIRFALFMFVQVFILFKIDPLHRFIIPYIYYLFILWLPFSVNRFWLLITGFITGLTLDYFTGQIGVHTAACVLIAYVRPFIISVLTPKDLSEFNYREPSPKAMGWAPYSVYVFVLTLLHHGYMTFLQWLQFGSFGTFLIKVIATTAISMLLMFTIELLFPRKLKYRTNKQ